MRCSRIDRKSLRRSAIQCWLYAMLARIHSRSTTRPHLIPAGRPRAIQFFSSTSYCVDQARLVRPLHTTTAIEADLQLPFTHLRTIRPDQPSKLVDIETFLAQLLDLQTSSAHHYSHRHYSTYQVLEQPALSSRYRYERRHEDNPPCIVPHLLNHVQPLAWKIRQPRDSRVLV